MNLTIEDLVDRLRALSADGIRQAGHHVRGEHGSAADEIAWWHATVHVEQLARRQHQRLAAATAAAVASQAVKYAALRAGLPLDDPDVVATARAASDAGTAVVVAASAQPELDYFIDRLGPALTRSLSAATVAA